MVLVLAACGGGGGVSIRGSVTVAGQAASGARIELLPGEAGEEVGEASPAAESIAEATADDQGRFEFEGVEPGDYQIIADFDVAEIGRCHVFAFVEVTEAGEATADIEVSDADIQSYLQLGGIHLLFNGDIMVCSA
jgi:hypothetical protein